MKGFLKTILFIILPIKNKQNEKKTLVVSSTLRWVGNQLKDLEKDICPLSVPHPYPKVKSNPGGCGQFLQRHQPPGPDYISRAPVPGTVRRHCCFLCLGPTEPRILSVTVMVMAAN